MNLTKEQQATHAYEILNMIAGDIFSATFFNQLTARWENDPRVNAEAKKIIVHLNRNRLRIAASALHRYIEVFESRIKFLEFDKTEAQTLNQKLNGHEISGLRHLFEHSLSKYTQEPHSPDIVTKYLEKFGRLFGADFDQSCLLFSKTVLRVRDSIAQAYPGCGTGVSRWKVDTVPSISKEQFGAATMPVGHGGNTVYGEGSDKK